MATSGAYYNQIFVFTYAIAKASDPTAFFTSTFAAGEVKVSKRTGTGTITTANIATLPVPNSTGLMTVSLSASEMSADEITVEFIPSTGDFGPRAVSIVTQPTPVDLLEVQQSAVSNVNDFKADVSSLSTFNAATDTVATVGTVSGAVGSISGVSFPTNFSDLAITATTGRVTVGTNADKTGYALSQSFPANFADLSVSATTGRVEVGSMAANTVTASAISSDAVTELQSGIATASALSTAAAEISSILADTGTDGVVISTATANAIADAILKRNVSNTETTADEHTLTTIVLAILESARTTTNWNIYRTNGSTVHATKNISTDAAALPVVGVS